MALMSTLSSLATISCLVACVAGLVPSPSLEPAATTQELPQTYTRQTDPPKPTTLEFRVPAPANNPAPTLVPSPAVINEPSPFPDPAPGPHGQAFVSPQSEPAPATTLEPLVTCDDDCHGHSCEYYLSTRPDMTCDLLRSEYMCDCDGCSCVNTYQYSCLNACSGTFPTCSCEQTCTDEGTCCSDFSTQCSEFDFDAVDDQANAQETTIAIAVSVGTVLLIGGAVGGFLIARKVILNRKLAKENNLLRRGNANLDAGVYRPPTLRATTGGHVRASPNSQFGLL